MIVIQLSLALYCKYSQQEMICSVSMFSFPSLFYGIRLLILFLRYLI